MIFDLEISGGHFAFVPTKFRPRVPKWHPADFCWGHPIVSESIIKHRPYRETRFSQNPLDYYGGECVMLSQHSVLIYPASVFIRVEICETATSRPDCMY